MRKITFGEPVLKIEGLEARFDVIPVSNSLAILIGDRDSASIVQQLYHWTEQGYGEVIDGVRWFYKSIKEWIAEVFPTFTPYQLGKLMAQLVERGIIRREKLFTKHQIQKGDRFWWQPKNQTYYYSLNTEKLQELADNFQVSKTPKTPENSVFIKTQILSNEEIKDTKDFDCPKNNTKNTSIENNSKDRSHPTLPCVSEAKKAISQNKQEFSNRSLLETKEVNSVNPEVIEKDTNVGRVEQNLNQNKSTNDRSTQPKTEQLQKPPRPSPKFQVTPTKQKRENKAPWKDELQRSQFDRALIQALPIVANSYSPQGLAKTIMAQLKRGEEHTYWDDFIAGLPIGTSTKPEWEITPGEPYPMFIEYLTEKIIKGNNTQTSEQARNEVFRILDKPRQAKAFWGQFKRSVVNVSEQVERDRALGVSNPNTPVWTRERIEPSVEEAATAGQKIMAVNGGDRLKIKGTETRCGQALPQLESKPESPTPDPWMDKSSSEPEPSSEEDKPESKPQQRDYSSGNKFRESRPQLSMREMLAQRKVKGFCKSMPKVSREEVEAEAKAESKAIARAQMNRKTHINQMSLNEINELLTDPIVRKELTSQIILNDKFDVVTDNLGEVLAVSINQEYLNSEGT